MKKKNLLFVMNNLNCGGAEKSLISVLETIDYSLYNVDLFLFNKSGIFLSKVPKQVNIINEQFNYRYFDMPIKNAILDCLKKGKIKVTISRIQAGFIFKTEKNRARCEQRVWRYLSRCLNAINKQYDAAIGFLEKNPIYFCVEKVNAKKKIGFIHTDYDKLGMDNKIDGKYFHHLDHIITVSERSAKILERKFPNYKEKIKIINNIISPSIIKKLSIPGVNIKNEGITIVSVGRLHLAKGYEMAVEACEMLVQNGYNIRWFIVGEGEERNKLEKMIEEKKLKGIFILLGVKENPYPYIREADIYVQSSRFEGKSIAVDEAKILQKPIVVTNFSTVKDQIQNGENGLISDMNSKSIFEGVKRLIEDEILRERLTVNLSQENLGNESEIHKLYKILS